MNMSQTDVCDLCNAEVGEDLEHVFFDCPVYDEIRLDLSSRQQFCKQAFVRLRIELTRELQTDFVVDWTVFGPVSKLFC
jgi:hypothetical protein